MRRLCSIGIVTLLVLGSVGAADVAANAAPQGAQGTPATDGKDLSVRAVSVHGSYGKGEPCTIARVEGRFPGFPQQVIFTDASGTIVAKHSLDDGKGTSNGTCEVAFTIPFPDSPFVTVFVDETRVITLEPSDLPLPDNAPLELVIRN